MDHLLRVFKRWLRGHRSPDHLARNPYLAYDINRPTRPGKYVWGSDEVQALAWLLARLDIPMPAADVIHRLGANITTADLHHIQPLLNFIIANRFTEEAGTVTRAANLPPAHFTRPLNILFITGEFPNPIHGGGGRVAAFIRELSRDHHVYLYTAYLTQNDAAALEALRPYCRKIHTENGHASFISNSENIKAFIGDVQMDVVHYEWPRSLSHYNPAWGHHHIFTFMEAVSLRLLVDLKKLPVNSPEWLQQLIGVFIALKHEVLDTRAFESRIVVTGDDGRFYAQFNPQSSFTVLNHGVDVPYFTIPDIAPETNTLAFVGHFGHYPNVDAAHFFCGSVLPLVQAELPDVKVYFIGAAPPPEVRAYHDTRRVFVTGTVEDIRPYIQKAAVCIAPLVSGAGLRSKVLQYAALKRPCVATTIAAADLQLSDGQEIVIADTAERFAQSVIQLLKQPAAARQMAEAAYARTVQYYDNRQLTRQLQSIYAQLINR